MLLLIGLDARKEHPWKREKCMRVAGRAWALETLKRRRGQGPRMFSLLPFLGEQEEVFREIHFSLNPQRAGTEDHVYYIRRPSLLTCGGSKLGKHWD